MDALECFVYNRQTKLLCVHKGMYFNPLGLGELFIPCFMALPGEGSSQMSFWRLTIRHLEALQLPFALSTSPLWFVPQTTTAGSNPAPKEGGWQAVFILREGFLLWNTGQSKAMSKSRLKAIIWAQKGTN